jgi:hypothetical protein
MSHGPRCLDATFETLGGADFGIGGQERGERGILLRSVRIRVFATLRDAIPVFEAIPALLQDRRVASVYQVDQCSPSAVLRKVERTVDNLASSSALASSSPSSSRDLASIQLLVTSPP